MNTIKVAFTPDEPSRSLTIQRYEELFQLRYMPHLQFVDWQAERWMRRQCARALQKGKIGQLALWLGKLHGQQIDKAEIPDLTIRWIDPEIGYGAFTNRSLKKWEFIGEYTGILRRRNLFISNINDYCFMYPRAWVALKSFTIDGQKQGNYTRFINHSDSPNCESVSVFHDGIFHIIFRAIEEIPAGSELTYDYGSVYWNRRKKLPEQPIEELIAPEDLDKIR